MALALAVRLGRALVIRLLLSPTGVVVGGAAPLPRAAAPERRAAELLRLPADGAGRRAVAVELAVALALALAAVHFFLVLFVVRGGWRERWQKLLLLLFAFFLVDLRQDSETAALQTCDKSGSGSG